jgi:hypothetical protein
MRGGRQLAGVVTAWVVLSASPAWSAERRAPTPEIIQRVAKDFAGWEVDAWGEGDLDGDKRADLVVTLKQPAGKGKTEAGAGDVAPPTWLAVYVRAAGGELRLHTRAQHAVCLGCGGMKAGPDEIVGTPSIDHNGVLTVDYEGGSREIWNFRLKWRLDKGTNHFALIGETYNAVDTLSEDGKGEAGALSSQDINYVTGKIVRKTVGQRPRTCTVKPGLAVPDLAAFDFEKFTDVDQKHVKGSCKP